jgi:methionyl-tRNA synthetase
MNEWRFDLALEAVLRFVTHCDQIISDKEPWTLAKRGEMRPVHDLLHHLAEAIRHIAVMIWPIMPDTAEKIIMSFGLDVGIESGKTLQDLQQWVELSVGNKVVKGKQLFPRLS